MSGEGTLSAGGTTGAPEASSAPAAEPERDLAAGDCVGRYTLGALLGAGGMGRVFVAHDPQLGRDVALKLIRPDRARSAARARARLVREARALARLRHPNVVTVHDAGTEGDDVFIAMELVEGTTLSRWLVAERRAWREVLAAFVSAGRGLAAAHALGIVHRDFKPDNVMVGGERVVVVDFGLARAAGDGDDERGQSDVTGSPSEPSLTLTGERLGTPRYMAPEQLAAAQVTAQADQYSFSLALWGALHDEFPVAGEPPPVRRREVPGWVNAALTRGLARAPEERWPSLPALLAALSRDPRAARRRAALAAGGVALAATAAWGLVAPHRSADPCAGAAARLAGVWDGPRRDAVRAAFAATGKPWQGRTFALVSARLDDYGRRWAEVHTEACRATRVEGRQSDTLMDLRMACLERRRAVLAGLTGVWAGGLDGDSLGAADGAAASLPPLAECSDGRVLGERVPLPAEPARLAAVLAARARVDEADALLLAYHLPQAREASARARADAGATGWAPVMAEAALVEGKALAGLNDPGGAPRFREAARLALAGRDDATAARALVGLVHSLGSDNQNAAQALLAADLAEGAVARAGDPALQAALLRDRGAALLTQGSHDAARIWLTTALALAGDERDALSTLGELARLANAQGDFAEARRVGERLLAGLEAELGPLHPRLLPVLQNLAGSVRAGGDNVASAAYYRRALALSEATAGPDSAPTALALHNVAIVEADLGHLDEARRLCERALAIRERVNGPEHPFTASTLGILAYVLRAQGHSDEALAAWQRALAIKTKVYGPAHASVAHSLASIGETYFYAGDLPHALEYGQRALDARRAALGDAHGETLYSMARVAEALAGLRRCDEARPLARAAADGMTKAFGAADPDVAVAVAILARCDLAAGHPELARAALEPAIATLDAHMPMRAASARFTLARALWSLGRRKEALAAARRADADLAANADGAHEQAAVRDWLADATRRRR